MSGTAWVMGNDVNTDEIIPGRHNLTTDPAELGRHVFCEVRPGLAGELRPGDVIVAGANFGCGSSREHAPVALKGAGLACVVAASFARIFFRNAVNVGLAILECPEAVAAIADGDTVEADPAAGTVRLERTGETFTARTLPPFVTAIQEAGGLVPYLRERGWPE